MEYSNYLGSNTTKDIRRTREIKSSIAMAKAVKNNNKKKTGEEEGGGGTEE
jgi:hypothetical protein